MNDFLKLNWVNALFIFLAITGAAYGASDFLPFPKGLVIFSVIFGVSHAIYIRFQKLPNSEVDNLERILEELDKTLTEQHEVIEYYESVLDTQVVKLECNCGKPLFDGILTSADSIVECESCQESYKVSVNYDKVLMSVSKDFNPVVVEGI